ncbi:hypothetical protein [Bradyrhizobium sp.]|uniref:hypothetical protein n=1 Tax=Bradyrhizobium sp. TaxID=376 RepID=UPI002637165C|nr:hypothetical protein [Bradyrhizobium sp.]
MAESARRVSVVEMAHDERNPPVKFDEAAEAVRDATQDVQRTSESIARHIKVDRRPGSVLVELTRAAPLRSLIIAFLAGYVLARRM